MDYRKYVLIFALLLGWVTVKAQETNVQLADSTSTSLSRAGDWRQLIEYGQKTIASGVDFPGLRLKVAFAYFITQNYKAAIEQYDHVLAKDAYNQTARFYSYYSNIFLNNDLAASYHARYLDAETKERESLHPFNVIDAALETGIKHIDNNRRGDGFYSRIGISNKLGWRLKLEESAIYFGQEIHDRFFTREHEVFINQSDNQKEYFAKLSYALNQQITLLGSYHYLNTRYRFVTFNSNVGLLGIKYAGNYVDLQGDVNFGNLIGQNIKQYNGKLTFYPLGNLNLYTISRLSDKYLYHKDHIIYGQTVGFRLMNKTWLESAVTFGKQEDYLDADGLYVYNSVDNTNFKIQETAFYQLTLHAQLQLTYMFEKKADAYFPVNTNQHSITAGIVWKF